MFWYFCQCYALPGSSAVDSWLHFLHDETDSLPPSSLPSKEDSRVYYFRIMKFIHLFLSPSRSPSLSIPPPSLLAKSSRPKKKEGRDKAEKGDGKEKGDKEKGEREKEGKEKWQYEKGFPLSLSSKVLASSLDEGDSKILSFFVFYFA
jgi:hypothetical protein